MSEIEKMYENAGIKKLLYCDICKAQEHALGLCAETKCEPFYPPFTAEKQIELIKWLARNEMLCRLEDEYPYFERFEECIAYIINYLWQDLREDEKQQVKGILE